MKPAILPLQKYLVALYDRYRGLTDGAVADYIPELAKADPDAFGICIVTADSYVYEVGDCDHEFTMQSVSKPAVYAAGLADQGRDGVLRKVGVEPSGEAFNSISLDPQTHSMSCHARRKNHRSLAWSRPLVRYGRVWQPHARPLPR